jgi:hypothetical protein
MSDTTAEDKGARLANGIVAPQNNDAPPMKAHYRNIDLEGLLQ